MNQESFERITLTKDETNKMRCFVFFVFIYTSADAVNTTYYDDDNWGDTPFYIMMALYCIELSIMTIIFIVLLYNLRFISYHNYLMHRKQLSIYFFWYFANTTMRALYTFLHH